MLEAAGMMILITLIFLTVFQLSQIIAAKEVTHHAAAAGARAKAVGFNDFMTWKVVKTAMIPNAGLMEWPESELTEFPDVLYAYGVGTSWDYSTSRAMNPRSHRVDTEMSRIPEFLGTLDWNEVYSILDYQDWDSVRWPITMEQDDMTSVRVRQDFPLKMPMHTFFYDDDDVNLGSRAWHGNYADIYLE